MVSDSETALQNYSVFLKKIDSKFTEIQMRNSKNFSCALGCYSCCKAGLTVSSIEAESIKNYLSAHEAVRNGVIENEKSDPHKGQHCTFLDASGACLIYEVRPVVCRSHGSPIKYVVEENEEKFFELDVCPLNFQQDSIAELSEENFMNIDTINTLLAALNMQFGDKTQKRFLLKASELLERNTF